MRKAFADTFYWIALANPRDQWHAKALVVCHDEAIEALVTTDAVLVEFLTQFSAYGASFRCKAAELVKAILCDPMILVVPQTRELFLAGLTFFASRPDKAYSMTDCMSMIIMKRDGLSDVLTFDSHFAQEGLRPLFRQ